MRVESSKIRQFIFTTDSVFDPDNPPERLAIFDETGAVVSLQGSRTFTGDGDPDGALGAVGDFYFDDVVQAFWGKLTSGWVLLAISGSTGGGGSRAYSEIVLADDPVAYYPLGANFDDYSGNDYHATANGGVTAGDVDGPPVSATLATHFDGDDDYLELPGAVMTAIKAGESLGSTGKAFTIEGWFYLEDASTSGTLARVGALGDGVGVGFGDDAGYYLPGEFLSASMESHAWIGGWATSEATELTRRRATQGRWTHWAVVFLSGKEVELYLNGERTHYYRSGTIVEAGGDAAYIGADGTNLTRFIKGRVAHVAFYSRGLTLGELMRRF